MKALAFLLLPFLAGAPAQAVETAVVESPAPAVAFTKHALSRMEQRGISRQQVGRAIERGEKFRYYHAKTWKVGYYDAGERLFVATDGKAVITVFKDASRSYVERLKRAKPR